MVADVVALGRAFIEADSQNPPGTERAVLETVLAAVRPLDPTSVTVLEPSPDRVSAVLVLPGPEAGPLLAVNAHLDTAATADHQWPAGRADCRVEGDWLIGRGASDMKGGLASVVAALHTVYAEGGPACRIALHLVADEERGSVWGAAQLADAGLLAADACLIPEPTGLAVSVAERGVLWARLRVQGEQTGGGRPFSPSSAVLAASRIATELHGASVTTGSPRLDAEPCSVGVVRAGDRPNAAPTEAEVQIDVRLTTADDPSAVLERVHALARRAAPENDCRLEVLKLVPATGGGADHAWGQEVARCLPDGEARLVGSPGPSDARYYRALGIPTVLCGPGDPAVAHRPGERVAVTALHSAARAYAHLFRTYGSRR
ncbi:M20 family metallopeptidase [Streptomyces similanensis]|uniref:M20 family metallopeptidase n=1 Tax=Streptomyces similanensis TaxID=1274988 RepID=A0ABP9LPD5_9ACTN